MIIVTNNESVYERYRHELNIEYFPEYTLLQVLEYCRDEVHLGGELLTHPLTGSIKPNETPFKSVMLERNNGPLHMASLTMIDSAIEVTRKFLNNAEVKDWPQRILDDFRVIDYGLISSGIESFSSLK